MQSNYKILKYLFAILVYIMLSGCNGGSGSTNSSVNNTNQNNVLVLTDIHMDPFSSCGSTPTAQSESCVLALINESNPESWSFPANSPNNYAEDSNDQFLISGLQGISQYINTNNITQVFVTGDLLSHDFSYYFTQYVPSGTQAQKTQLVTNTINYVLYQIEQATNHAKIYYALGNNDTDQGDYAYPSVSFFQQLTPEIAQYMANPESFAATFPNGGYSAMPLNANVSVLSLNLNPLTVQSEPQESALAESQLSWMTQQLSQARANGQKVIILQHEPFGMNSYNLVENYTPIINFDPVLQQEYLDVYQEYSDVITNYYYGHYHMEGIQSGINILGIGTIGFSVVFNNNPGFKILQLNQNGQLQNYTTYYTNYADNTFLWQPLYSLNSAYNITPSGYLDFFQTQLQVGTNQYWQNYVNNYAANVSSITESLVPILQSQNWPTYFCVINEFTESSYNQCMQ